MWFNLIIARYHSPLRLMFLSSFMTGIRFDKFVLVLFIASLDTVLYFVSKSLSLLSHWLHKLSLSLKAFSSSFIRSSCRMMRSRSSFIRSFRSFTSFCKVWSEVDNWTFCLIRGSKSRSLKSESAVENFKKTNQKKSPHVHSTDQLSYDSTIFYIMVSFCRKMRWRRT